MAGKRRLRLPRDWPKRVSAVRKRAHNLCEGITIDGVPHQHVADCGGAGRECDHRMAGDDHSLSNLQWLSVECHLAKTLAENAARRALLKLPVEHHPGVVGGLPHPR